MTRPKRKFITYFVNTVMLSLRMAKDKIGTCDSKPIKLQIADKKSASRIC